MMKIRSSAFMIVMIVVGTLSLAFNVQQSTSSSCFQPLTEPPPTEWTQAYGGTGSDSARALVRTSDGGYAIAGYTNSYGAGQTDAWLVKTDASGNAQWTKTYGGAGGDTANALVQTVDGGYALAGYTDSYGAGGVDFWLVKVDSSGNLQWSKTYGGTKTDIANALIQTTDGGYALGGMTVSYCVGEADFWLVKTDANGNAQWTHAYGGAVHEEGQSLVQAADGGYALAGWTNSYGAGADDMWLVKTDSTGNPQWTKTYGGSWYDEAWALVRTTDGGYALAGETVASVNSYTESYLVKTDGNGNTQWEKTYEWSMINRAHALVQTTDGGYALAGYAYPPANIYCDFWLVKTDSAGNQQWIKTCGGADNHEMAKALVQTVDGGCAMAGYTNSYGAGGADFWLVKLGATAPPSTYSLTISATAGGTTIPAPGVYEYGVGTVALVTALQDSGYQFDHWELDSVNVGSANPYSVTMNAAHTLRAVFAGAPAGCGWPVLVAPVQISSSTGYSVGDTLTVEFTIQNQGTAAIHLDKLLLGGRFNGGTLPGGGFPDFNYNSMTLQISQTYQYEGTLYLTDAGYYQFFVAYYIANPTEAEQQLLDSNNWNTCIDLAEGLTDQDRIEDITVGSQPPSPEITAIVPPQPIAGSGKQLLSILGEGFVPDSEVALKIGSDPWRVIPSGRTLFISANKIEVVAGLGTIPSQLKALVTNPGNIQSNEYPFPTRSVLDEDIRKVLALALQYWTAEDAVKMTAIAGGESGWNPNTAGDLVEDWGIKWDTGKMYDPNINSVGACSWGLWQILMPGWLLRLEDLAETEDLGQIAKWLGNPNNNAQAAYEIWKVFKNKAPYYDGFRAWSAYTQTQEPSYYKNPSIWNRVINVARQMGIFVFQCPVNVTITDDHGRVISEIENQIPGAGFEYFNATDTKIFYLPLNLTYRVQVNATDYGNVTISQITPSESIYEIAFSCMAFNLTNETVAEFSLLPYDANYTAEVDEDGDGEFDYGLIPETETMTTEYDVGVGETASSRSVLGEGYHLHVNAVVRNYGAHSETFNVTFYMNETFIEQQNVTLSNGTSANITTLWDTAGLAKGSYTLTVVANPVSGETYTEDNTMIKWLMVTIPGDADSDRDVDIFDIVHIAGDYGKPPPPLIDPNCDIDDDGDVDIFDIVAAATHYGESW